LCSCLLIIISTLTYLYIEKPGINAGKKTLLWLRSSKKGQEKPSEKVVQQR
jgi:peptidoglycan/LPS O-acetylase OafA/YrhL